MNVGQVLTGLGLGTFAVASCAFWRWYVRDDERLRNMARSRWGWDRVTQRRLRNGVMAQEAWFNEFISGQRKIVKWGYTPFMILATALCAAMVIHGLLSH